MPTTGRCHIAAVVLTAPDGYTAVGAFTAAEEEKVPVCHTRCYGGAVRRSGRL